MRMCSGNHFYETRNRLENFLSDARVHGKRFGVSSVIGLATALGISILNPAGGIWVGGTIVVCTLTAILAYSATGIYRIGCSTIIMLNEIQEISDEVFRKERRLLLPLPTGGYLHVIVHEQSTGLFIQWETEDDSPNGWQLRFVAVTNENKLLKEYDIPRERSRDEAKLESWFLKFNHRAPFEMTARRK